MEWKVCKVVDSVSLLFLSVAQTGYFVAQSNLLSQQPLSSDTLNQDQIEDSLLQNLLTCFGIHSERDMHLEFHTPRWVEKQIAYDVGIFSEELQRRVTVRLLKRIHIAGFLAVDKPRYLAAALLWRLAVSVVPRYCWKRVACSFGWKNKEGIKVDRISEFLDSTEIETKRLVMKLICADVAQAYRLPTDLLIAQVNAGENWTESKLLRFLQFVVADACSLQRVWKMDHADNNFGYGLGGFASTNCLDQSTCILQRLESLVDLASSLPDSLSNDVLKCWIQWCNGSSRSIGNLRRITLPCGESLNGIAVTLYTVHFSTMNNTPKFSVQDMQKFQMILDAFSTGIINDDCTLENETDQINSLNEGYVNRVQRLKALSATIITSRENPKGVSLMLGVAVSSKNDEVFIGVTEKYRTDAVELLIWVAMQSKNYIPILAIDNSNKTMHHWILKRVAEMVFAPHTITEKLPVNERNEMKHMLSNLNDSITQAWFGKFHQDSITITSKALRRVKLDTSSTDGSLIARQSCCEAFESAQKKLNESCICDYNNPPQLSLSELSALFVWFDREAICLEPLLTPHSKSLDLVCIQFGPIGQHATNPIGNRFQAKPCTRYCSLFSSAHVVWSRLVEGVNRNSMRDNFGDDEF